jgi:hypothetical protein
MMAMDTLACLTRMSIKSDRTPTCQCKSDFCDHPKGRVCGGPVKCAFPSIKYTIEHDAEETGLCEECYQHIRARLEQEG